MEFTEYYRELLNQQAILAAHIDADDPGPSGERFIWEELKPHGLAWIGLTLALLSGGAIGFLLGVAYAGLTEAIHG